MKRKSLYIALYGNLFLMKDNKEIEQRKPIWIALSTFYLNTEYEVIYYQQNERPQHFISPKNIQLS